MLATVSGPETRQTVAVAGIEVGRTRGAHTLNLMCCMRYLIAGLKGCGAPSRTLRHAILSAVPRTDVVGREE